MADIKISDYAAAAALDGSELVEVVQTGANVQTTTGDIAALAQGAFQKLAEVVVSSAQTDIDFTSLDLDADGIYRLEVFVIPNSAATHIMSVLYNGDTTNSNYTRQYMGYIANTLDVGRDSNPYVFFAPAPDTTTPFAFGTTIRKAPGAKPLTETGFGPSVYSDGSLFATMSTTRWTSTANVTSIKLRNSVTNGFGVGSFARLYKLA